MELLDGRKRRYRRQGLIMRKENLCPSFELITLNGLMNSIGLIGLHHLWAGMLG